MLRKLRNAIAWTGENISNTLRVEAYLIFTECKAGDMTSKISHPHGQSKVRLGAMYERSPVNLKVRTSVNFYV